ncbi:EamA/RhaT family transporter [Pseudonocardia sp. TMWB2A]|uniref:DMT family transporter n=1 Tax=Pseudonocardia sp. TMWB2A TaxID=687430 RepID=UPI00307F7E5F
MPVSRSPIFLPFLAACLGIALFSVMDGFMKGLSIAFGAYNAMLWRTVTGSGIGIAAFAVRRGKWPAPRVLRLHIWRGFVVMVMALCFFWGIARVPLAEGIALSFIAPLVALYLAAVLLKERIGGAAIIASMLGLCGVGIILLGKLGGTYAPDAPYGVAAILMSALFYAYNLILQRQQALIAGPTEIALFQNLTIAGMLLLAAPWFAVLPTNAQWPAVLASASLAFASQMLLSWAYARAEAQRLLVVEYTAFIWAAIVGYIAFDEALTPAILAGAALIVAGCLIVARIRPRLAAPVSEAAV